MAGVWVFAENYEHGLELLQIGRSLADKTGVELTAFACGDKEVGQQYIYYGAHQVFILPPLAEDQPLETYVPAITEVARQEDPDIFLFAATLRGKEIAARVAARLNTGLCSECIELDIKDNKLEMKRVLYGGAAIQTLICKTRPQMATIPVHTFTSVTDLDNTRQGIIKEFDPISSTPVKVRDRQPRAQESGDITRSRVLVCVGRGVEKEEDLKLARELAEILGGDLACTRPIAEELHWMPQETYIGLSGQTVKPELYIGLGISGQIQHTTGIRDSRIICTINKDEDAPIFKISDYGIVGDLYKVVPFLSQELARLKKK